MSDVTPLPDTEEVPAVEVPKPLTLRGGEKPAAFKQLTRRDDIYLQTTEWSVRQELWANGFADIKGKVGDDYNGHPQRVAFEQEFLTRGIELPYLVAAWDKDNAGDPPTLDDLLDSTMGEMRDCLAAVAVLNPHERMVANRARELGAVLPN